MDASGWHHAGDDDVASLGLGLALSTGPGLDAVGGAGLDPAPLVVGVVPVWGHGAGTDDHQAGERADDQQQEGPQESEPQRDAEDVQEHAGPEQHTADGREGLEELLEALVVATQEPAEGSGSSDEPAEQRGHRDLHLVLLHGSGCPW